MVGLYYEVTIGYDPRSAAVFYGNEAFYVFFQVRRGCYDSSAQWMQRLRQLSIVNSMSASVGVSVCIIASPLVSVSRPLSPLGRPASPADAPGPPPPPQIMRTINWSNHSISRS